MNNIEELTDQLKNLRVKKQAIGKEVSLAQRDLDDVLKQLEERGVDVSDPSKIRLVDYIEDAKEEARTKEVEAEELLTKASKRFDKLTTELEEVKK